MSQFQAKKVISYVMLPGIIPRAKHLFASGFGRIAFLMAEIYAMVRLLPRNHPYLNPQNIGQYGIRHVIAAAANHLVIKKENIDQIVIFLALLVGAVLLVMQFALLAYSFVIHPAAASIFATPFPEKDIAFMLLDKVFGIPGMFKSCVSTPVLCPSETTNLSFPYPFHVALHSLFQFYSKGLLMVACLIFLYFVVVVTAETATTGSPFGQRFQNVWVPVRLIVAIGLLLPLTHGLNSAQYITLIAAKMGSGMATTTWTTFNQAIKDHALFTGSRQNPLGEYDSLIGLPKPADASILTEMMSIVHSCAYAYWVQKGPIGIPAGDDDAGEDTTMINGKYYYTIPPDEKFFIQPYFVKKLGVNPTLKNKETHQALTPATTYINALDFYNNQDIIIRFGRRSESEFSSEPGSVEATCGEIRIPVIDIQNKGKGAEVGGADYMLAQYFKYIHEMWFSNHEFQDFAQRFMQIRLKPFPYLGDFNSDFNGDLACAVACSQPADFMAACYPNSGKSQLCASSLGLPTQKWKQHVVDQYNTDFLKDLTEAWMKYAQSADIELKKEVLDLGWGGAGVWYNTIAKLNGLFVTAVMATPKFITYPKVMEEVAQYNRRTNQSTGGLTQYAPVSGLDYPTDIGTADELQIATALNDVYEFWNHGGRDGADPAKENTSNIVLDTMNLLLGTADIFTIRKENAYIHPMAQLTTIGKGLVESAIMNIMGASASAFAGGALSAMDPNSGIGKLATSMSSFLQSVAFIGLTAGVVLFYILPFLPFLYFFFAVGEWIKAIFEAMVGVPLWAMAHLRLDGEGLPGEAAKDGYFLILEIFLRPVLTVIALIAATVIFTAQARILNSIWDIVLATSPGYDPDSSIVLADFMDPIPRSTIDTFFYTIVYTFVLYMMATAAFKLINQLPDNLLRWAGAGVSAFGDINSQDPLQELQRYAAIGGITIGRQAVQAVTTASGGMGQVAGQIARGGGTPTSVQGQSVLGPGRDGK